MSLLTNLPCELINSILHNWINLQEKALSFLDVALTSSDCRANLHASVAAAHDLMRDIAFPWKATGKNHICYVRWLVKRNVKMTKFCFTGEANYDKIWRHYMIKEQWDLTYVDYVCFCLCPIIKALNSLEYFPNVATVHFINEPEPIVQPEDFSKQIGLDDNAYRNCVPSKALNNVNCVILSVFNGRPSLGFHILALHSLTHIFQNTDVFHFEFGKVEAMQSDEVVATMHNLFDAEITYCDDQLEAFNEISGKWESYCRITLDLSEQDGFEQIISSDADTFIPLTESIVSNEEGEAANLE